jgi:hypothetical protein
MDPSARLVNLDQFRLPQNLHVMRNSGLGQLDAPLDVGGAKALGVGTVAEEAENLPAGWVGNGSESHTQLVSGGFHGMSEL